MRPPGLRAAPKDERHLSGGTTTRRVAAATPGSCPRTRRPCSTPPSPGAPRRRAPTRRRVCGTPSACAAPTPSWSWPPSTWPTTPGPIPPWSSSMWTATWSTAPPRATAPSTAWPSAMSRCCGCCATPRSSATSTAPTAPASGSAGPPRSRPAGCGAGSSGATSPAGSPAAAAASARCTTSSTGRKDGPTDSWNLVGLCWAPPPPRPRRWLDHLRLRRRRAGLHQPLRPRPLLQTATTPAEHPGARRARRRSAARRTAWSTRLDGRAPSQKSDRVATRSGPGRRMMT